MTHDTYHAVARLCAAVEDVLNGYPVESLRERLQAVYDAERAEADAEREVTT